VDFFSLERQIRVYISYMERGGEKEGRVNEIFLILQDKLKLYKKGDLK